MWHILLKIHVKIKNTCENWWSYRLLLIMKLLADDSYYKMLRKPCSGIIVAQLSGDKSNWRNVWVKKKKKGEEKDFNKSPIAGTCRSHPARHFKFVSWIVKSPRLPMRWLLIEIEIDDAAQASRGYITMSPSLLQWTLLVPSTTAIISGSCLLLSFLCFGLFTLLSLKYGQNLFNNKIWVYYNIKKKKIIY